MEGGAILEGVPGKEEGEQEEKVDWRKEREIKRIRKFRLAIQMKGSSLVM